MPTKRFVKTKITGRRTEMRDGRRVRITTKRKTIRTVTTPDAPADTSAAPAPSND